MFKNWKKIIRLIFFKSNKQQFCKIFLSNILKNFLYETCNSFLISQVRNVRNENNRRRNPDSSTNQDCEKRTRTSNNYNTRGKYIAQSRFNNPYFQRHANKFTPGTSWSYHPHTNPAQPPQSSPSFTQFPNPNPFVTAVPSPYPNNPLPFGTFRFPNIRPFPPGNFLVNAMTPPPPPPPTASSVQTTQMSYPTRTTGPPPFSSFMTPQPANRMPIPPFPFNQGFPQQQTFYSQPVQFNPRPPPPPPPPSVSNHFLGCDFWFDFYNYFGLFLFQT